MKKNKYLKSVKEAKKTASKKGTQIVITAVAAGGTVMGIKALKPLIPESLADYSKYAGGVTLLVGGAGKIFAKDENLEAVCEGIIAGSSIDLISIFAPNTVTDETQTTGSSSTKNTSSKKSANSKRADMRGLGVDWNSLYNEVMQTNALNGNPETIVNADPEIESEISGDENIVELLN